jgi:hypothetical protein
LLFSPTFYEQFSYARSFNSLPSKDSIVHLSACSSEFPAQLKSSRPELILGNYFDTHKKAWERPAG